MAVDDFAESVMIKAKRICTMIIWIILSIQDYTLNIKEAKFNNYLKN